MIDKLNNQLNSIEARVQKLEELRWDLDWLSDNATIMSIKQKIKELNKEKDIIIKELHKGDYL